MFTWYHGSNTCARLFCMVSTPSSTRRSKVTDQDIFKAIVVLQNFGVAVTTRALARETGMAPSGMHHRLIRLTDAGVIGRTAGSFHLLPAAIDAATDFFEAVARVYLQVVPSTGRVWLVSEHASGE